MKIIMRIQCIVPAVCELLNTKQLDCYQHVFKNQVIIEVKMTKIFVNMLFYQDFVTDVQSRLIYSFN